MRWNTIIFLLEDPFRSVLESFAIAMCFNKFYLVWYFLLAAIVCLWLPQSPILSTPNVFCEIINRLSRRCFTKGLIAPILHNLITTTGEKETRNCVTTTKVRRNFRQSIIQIISRPSNVDRGWSTNTIIIYQLTNSVILFLNFSIQPDW